MAQVKNLPEGIDGKPLLNKLTSSDIPVVEIAIAGEHSILNEFVPFLENQIKEVEGVSSIDTVGLPDEEVNILVNAKAAKKSMVDLASMSRAIKARNVEGTGGTFTDGGLEKKIVALNKYENVQDILDTNIRISSDGKGVKLRDVAKVFNAPKDVRLIVRNNGKRGATLLVKKLVGLDILKMVEDINLVIKKISLPSGVSLKIMNDQSNMARARLKVVVSNSIIGFILVILIMFIVFDFRTAFWTSFGIPFSLLSAYICFPLMGLNLDVLSLGGFIIVIGLVVDDAIVVAEQINSYKEKGLSNYQASLEAVSDIWKPVLTATLTTIIAFSTLLSLGGLPGKFVWVIPLIVILVLTFSLIDAYFLLPLHLKEGSAKKIVKKKFIIKIEKVYSVFMFKALRYKYIVILIFIALLGSSVFVAKNYLPKDPFPQGAAESFYLHLTLPVGTTLEVAEAEVKKLELVLDTINQVDLVGYSSRIGTHSFNSATYLGSQNNLATVFVYLTPFGDRKKGIHQIVDQLKTQTKNLYSKETVLTYNIIRLGPPLGNAYEINVTANEDVLRNNTVLEIKKALEGLPGILDIQDDYIIGKDEFNIDINYDRLESVGLTVSDVLLAIRTAFDGQIVSQVTSITGTKDFRLRLDKSSRQSLNVIKVLPVLNKYGRFINLSKFVKIIKVPSRGEINHLNGKRTRKIYGNINKKLISAQQIFDLVLTNFKSDHKLHITFAGESVEADKIFSNLISTGLIAVLGIYLLIALMFNSFLTPLIIMSAIPFILIGISWSLFFNNMAISIFAGLAAVGLMGIIVNDSIVLIHTINKNLEDSDYSLEKIISSSSSRIRPVLLTSLTTLAGLLPTAYGVGGSDPFLSPMCMALAYGLLFGTLVVLVLIPSLYVIGDDIKRLFGRNKRSAVS